MSGRPHRAYEISVSVSADTWAAAGRELQWVVDHV